MANEGRIVSFDGNPLDAPQLRVIGNIETPEPTIGYWTGQSEQSVDDGEEVESTGLVTTNNWNNVVGTSAIGAHYRSGFMFPIYVPVETMDIQEAMLTFRVTNLGLAPNVNATIRYESEPDAAPYNALIASHICSRNLGFANINLGVGYFGGAAAFYQVDVTALMKEWFHLGYQVGNRFNLIFTESTAVWGQRVEIATFDHGGGGNNIPPRLAVTYLQADSI